MGEEGLKEGNEGFINEVSKKPKAVSATYEPQLCTAQLRGCLHRGTSGTGGAAYLESLHEPYDIGTILIPSYTYHDKT